MSKNGGSLQQGPTGNPDNICQANGLIFPSIKTSFAVSKMDLILRMLNDKRGDQ